MITGILSCPHPPLLLPGLTGHPVAEVERLRTACLDAIAGLLADPPDVVAIVGGARRAEQQEPLSISVGRSLLGEALCAVDVAAFPIADDAPPAECENLGRRLRERPGRIALLVMADGSARRSVKAPGYLDDRAAPFDGATEKALAAGDPSGLAALDQTAATDLLVAGRAAWHVMAAAATGQKWQAELSYSDDPFGVWYPVARWRPSD